MNTNPYALTLIAQRPTGDGAGWITQVTTTIGYAETKEQATTLATRLLDLLHDPDDGWQERQTLVVRVPVALINETMLMAVPKSTRTYTTPTPAEEDHEP